MYVFIEKGNLSLEYFKNFEFIAKKIRQNTVIHMLCIYQKGYHANTNEDLALLRLFRILLNLLQKKILVAKNLEKRCAAICYMIIYYLGAWSHAPSVSKTSMGFFFIAPEVNSSLMS